MNGNADEGQNGPDEQPSPTASDEAAWAVEKELGALRKEKDTIMVELGGLLSDERLTETKQLIDGIEEGAKRTHTIVEGLTSFSRGDMVKKSKSDVNRGIRSTISVLKSRLNNVKLITSLDKNLPLLSCQVGKINQVALSLTSNALDALEDKNGSNKKVSELIVETKDLGGFSSNYYK